MTQFTNKKIMDCKVSKIRGYLMGNSGGSERSNDREQVHQPTDYPVVRLKPDNVVRSNKQYEVDTLDM